MNKFRFLLFTLLVSASLVGVFGLDTYAADARNFNAGRIIDDSIFTNRDSMTAQDIQNFLNSKVTCDTYGAKRSELGGGTRAQWMGARGIYAPFRCVTDYRENISTGQNNYSNTNTIPGSVSAAEIIYMYAQQFSINPQVIIATLQKENGMITDEWPTPKQFSEAMGFGCPDNVAPGAPACDPSYGSFAAQVYQAARHFRGYLDNKPGWWVPFSTGWNSIAWSPTASCGRGDVYIENRATVALYSYTPYQPNQAAKNAQYGAGDSCSAYGNRNFYLYFTDWFGSTYSDVAITSPLRIEGATSGRVYTGTQTKVSFSIHNYRGTAINIGGMSVAVRGPSGENYDYSLKSMTIPAYTTINYEDVQVFSKEGVYNFEIVNYSGGLWKSDYPSTRFAGHTRTAAMPVRHMPTVIESVTINSSAHSQSESRVSFKVKNNSTSTMDIGRVGLAVRGPAGENLDAGSEPVTLSPGQVREFAYIVRFPAEGRYILSIAATTDEGRTWESNYPALGMGVQRMLTQTAKPPVTLTEGVAVDRDDIYIGQQAVNISFKLKNHSTVTQSAGKLGFWGRDPQNRNVDPGIIDVTLAPGEERTITFPVAFNQKGRYQYGILATNDNGRTWTSGPEGETAGLRVAIDVNSQDPLLLVGGVLSSEEVQQRVGGIYNLSYVIKNTSPAPVSAGKLGFWGRDPQNRNVDPGIIDVTLAPGEERTITFPVTFNQKGRYQYGILGTTDNGRTWTSGPDRIQAGANRTASIDVKPVVTALTGIQYVSFSQSTGSLSFKLKNHSTVTQHAGKLGFWGRDPQNRNVDPGIIDVTLAPGEERTITFPVTFNQKGRYQYGILGTTDNGRTWTSGPEGETAGLRVVTSVALD